MIFTQLEKGCYHETGVEKEATSRIAHLEKFSLNNFVVCNPSIFSILVPLCFITISLVFFFSFLVNYYFKVSFNLKVILYVADVTQGTVLSSFQ